MGKRKYRLKKQSQQHDKWQTSAGTNHKTFNRQLGSPEKIAKL